MESLWQRSGLAFSRFLKQLKPVLVGGKGLGGAVAVALLALTYSGPTFFCVVLWAGEEQLDTESITIKNWHLIEIYALWVLLIYAPISLRELLIEIL